MNALPARTDDPFLKNYNATELRIASEFLSNWLPFLSRGLCPHCTQTLSDRVRSLHPADDGAPLKQEEILTVSTPNNMDLKEYINSLDNDTNSLGIWKDGAEMNDTNSLGSWKDGANAWAEPIEEASASDRIGLSVHVPVESPRKRMSWADMAQEDELESEEENEMNAAQLSNGNAYSGEGTEVVKVSPKPELPREQREYIRFTNVKRKQDFICLERVKGKIVNILDGLELHTGVFSAVEQKRIVDFVYVLEEMGKNGELEGYQLHLGKWLNPNGRLDLLLNLICKDSSHCLMKQTDQSIQIFQNQSVL